MKKPKWRKKKKKTKKKVIFSLAPYRVSKHVKKGRRKEEFDESAAELAYQNRALQDAVLPSATVESVYGQQSVGDQDD